MKSILSALTLAAALLAGQAQAAEVTATFDEYGPTLQPVGAYQGLDFHNFATLAPSAYPWMAPTGYAHGLVSADNIAFNLDGAPASINAPAGHFSLLSAFFTAAWIDGLKLKVKGLDNGVVKFSKTVTLNTAAPVKVVFNWAEVTEVTFQSYFCGCSPKGRQFVMDDLKLTTVPEPSTWALMIVGFAGAGSVIRHARRRGALAV